LWRLLITNAAVGDFDDDIDIDDGEKTNASAVIVFVMVDDDDDDASMNAANAKGENFMVPSMVGLFVGAIVDER
jgi:hypothetical protein